MKSGAELLRAREPGRSAAHSGDRRIMQMAGIPGLHFIASGLVWYALHPRGAGVEGRSGLSAAYGQTNVAMSPLCLH